MKVLATAVLSFLVWLVVTWTFDRGSLAAGVVVSAVVAWAFRRVEMGEVRHLLSPVRLFWALVYVPVLLFYIVRSNLDVAYRVIHPRLPIRPGITRARTTLTSIPGRALLANSVTLTPGTMSVDLVGDVLYVHRIWVPETDPDGETERELVPFERLIRRIFE
ncbi:MAG: cation:proton antiporter [Acidobacteria bacterium]|jgi:multicomponent Na+:H+ antiporter subunit E|nr:cation:proton antiporter [Acidobacteriota bacterium]